MRAQHARPLLFMVCISYVQCLVHGIPSPSVGTATGASPPGTADNALGESIVPPAGFSCRFRRAGQGRVLISKDLYSATLYALLHFSLLNENAPAQAYNTRGSEEPGEVVVASVPFFLPTAATLNTHIVWGLYRSVIAYNNPDNTRESLASVYIHGLQVADIETLKIPRLQAQAQAPVASDQGLGNDTTHLTPTSALQTLSKLDHRPKAGAMMAGDAAGFKLHWVLVARGETIRRETAYDAVAYAILWTSQYDQGASARGTRTLSVPGGDVFVRFVAYPPESRIPTLTIGFFATIANSIPKFLEASERFQEGFVQVLTANGQACGLIGIWKRGSAGDLASALPMNPTSPKLSAMSDTGQAQDN